MCNVPNAFGKLLFLPGFAAKEKVKSTSKKMWQKLLRNMHVCHTRAITEHTEAGKRV